MKNFLNLKLFQKEKLFTLAKNVFNDLYIS